MRPITSYDWPSIARNARIQARHFACEAFEWGILFPILVVTLVIDALWRTCFDRTSP